MNYANHYADYAVITQIHYANTITQFPKISLRRLRKYHFHYASLRNGQLADGVRGTARSSGESVGHRRRLGARPRRVRPSRAGGRGGCDALLVTY